MAKPSEREKQHDAVRALGQPPFVIVHARAYEADLEALPLEVFRLAELAEEELRVGALVLYRGKAALKRLDSDLLGMWRLAFGPVSGPQYRLCFLPHKGPKRGQTTLIMHAALPRAMVYTAVAKRIGREPP
jgi:hypothetical protein